MRMETDGELKVRLGKVWPWPVHWGGSELDIVAESHGLQRRIVESDFEKRSPSREWAADEVTR